MQKKSRQYKVSGINKNIVTKIGENGWVCIICENVLNEKIEYKWKIKIIKSFNRNPTVGIAPIDYDFNSKEPLFSGWFFSCFNYVFIRDLHKITKKKKLI